MSNNSLRQIYERSQLLISPTVRGDMPFITRSLDQIQQEIKNMSEKIRPTQELHAKAHYFLASNGITTEHVPLPINTSRTFEMVEMEDHTNIKKFLEEEHEKILIETIEEQRTINDQEFQEFYDKQFQEFSQAMERVRLEEGENMTELKEFEKNNNGHGRVRINDYAQAVSQLNDNRLQNTDFDVIKSFSSIRNMSELKSAQDSAIEAWDILGHLVNKSGIQGRLEGRFLQTYVTEPFQSAAATNTRRALIVASKSWLENQYSQYINDALNKNAKKLLVGGIPSFTHRLKAYIDLVFKTATGWTDSRLEVVEELPIWVFIYLLMRSGHLDIAAKFIDHNREKFSSERKFVSYFEQYFNAQHHCVSKPTQEAILADYHKFEYGEQVVDPYKVLIYKIIGRCELYNKSLPQIIQTTEDYIWLQLSLVREFTDTEAVPFERYRLADVQNRVSSYGSEYFDREASNPWIYFKILLMTLQFEKAIDYLYKQKRLRLETVHFSIGLVYHGLLRVPQTSKLFASSILIQEGNTHMLDWVRLVYQYVQVYLANDAKKALEYISLFSLYSPKQGYHDQGMIQLAKSYTCKYTMASKEFKAILGSVDDKKIPGFIDKLKGLLDISTEQEFVEQVLYPIAEQCVYSGRCADAVYVYSLCHDYNKMVDVLAKELSDALQQSQSFRATDPTLSQLSNDEIIRSATETMENYEKHEQFCAVIDSQRKQTIRGLIHLLEFRSLYEKGHYGQALQLLEYINVIPLTEDFYHMQLLVSQFNTLDETIKKNIPELLLNAMDILYKIWDAQSSNLSTPTAEIETLERKVRAVLTFTGLIQFYIPSDIIIRLNKADMLISARRK